MRRDIKIQFYVNREEADELKRKANSAGMSQARLIRMLLDGYNPPPAPDEKFFEAMTFSQRCMREWLDCHCHAAMEKRPSS